MNFLLARCHRRAHLAEELVEEAWLEGPHNGTTRYAVNDLICECVDLVKLLRHTWAVLLDALFDDAIDDIDGVGRALLASVDRAATAVERVYSLARVAANADCPVERIEDIGLVVDDLKLLRLDIENRWPKIDLHMIAEATTAYSRGDYRSAEDWLRESQGHGAEAD